MYEAIKDAVTLAQKLNNIDLVRMLMDAQAEALKMQDVQQKQSQKISSLEREIETLKEMKKLVFADGKNYLIDPDNPDRHLCPLCTKKHNTPVPMTGHYCGQCKGQYTR
ncbi:MAG: hypothetical protein WCP11_02125 [Candidatus Saccharibacteria bacterium]